MSGLLVDPDLIGKYSVPAPRYTSYPPATTFTNAVDSEVVAREMKASLGRPRELSLYCHIPFCETLCWFCGCTTHITRDHRLGAGYVQRLVREMDRVAPWLHPGCQVVQMHWGGGTPTFLTPGEIRSLGAAMAERFRFADQLEAGVEIDPRHLSRDHVFALREAGFNRASMGVQDFDPQVQLAVHRIQPRDLTAQAINWVREAGFRSLNLDLIYGLPHQTVGSFDRTLDQILELKPDRLAVFNYAHVPWLKPSQKIFDQRGVLPSPEVRLELLRLVIDKLTRQGGYTYIGMDHFALPGDELAVAQRQRTLQRNFQGYSTHGGTDLQGFGMSAISQTADAYWQNLKELEGWQRAVDSGALPVARGYLLTTDDKIRRATIMEIMCNLGLEYAVMSARLGIVWQDYFSREIESLDDLEADGLVRRSSSALDVTETGRLFVRNIAMRFDAYLTANSEHRFSRAV